MTSPDIETRESVALTDWQRGRIIRQGIRDIRALPAFSRASGAMFTTPDTDYSWLVDPRTIHGNGVRLTRFNRRDGSLEMIDAHISYQRSSEGKRTTVPSQLIWQDLSSDSLPQVNTDVAAGRFNVAIDEITSIREKDRPVIDNDQSYA